MLLAAGASVEAKNDNGCGPQRRDGCDRRDAVGRRCNRGNVAEMRHAIEFATSFGNFVPGIFSVLYVDSRQQLQVCVAAPSGPRQGAAGLGGYGGPPGGGPGAAGCGRLRRSEE